jgi:hypothetical protein
MGGANAARRVLALAAGLAVCLAAGCAPKPPSKATVSGKVDFGAKKPDDKTPVMLALKPLDDANQDNTPAVALTDGKFEFKDILTGRYRAYLRAVPKQVNGPGAPGGGPGAPIGAPSKAAVGDLPAVYFDADKSPWEVTAPEGGKADVTLTVADR